MPQLSRPGPKSRTTYAVLAVLSDRCPPLKGRLPTCYSPVRRFTQGRSPFLARLACVRPAANVRSEPGSNSPLKSSTLTPPALMGSLVLPPPNARPGRIRSSTYIPRRSEPLPARHVEASEPNVSSSLTIQISETDRRRAFCVAPSRDAAYTHLDPRRQPRSLFFRNIDRPGGKSRCRKGFSPRLWTPNSAGPTL